MKKCSMHSCSGSYNPSRFFGIWCLIILLSCNTKKIAFSIFLVMLCSQLTLFSVDILAVAKIGTVEEIQQAINTGADVNSKNAEVLSVLIKAGADIYVKDDSGKTAFDYAKDNPAVEGTEVYCDLSGARYE